MAKLHRFYTGSELDLTQKFWLHDERLLNQWNKVLRFRADQEVVLFDGSQDRLYKITELKPTEAHMQLVTELATKRPKREVYLFWALLKKDKNDWVLQKCTELGVSHFVPLLTRRAEKENINLDRATKIIIEAAEQCGRSDIPHVREPMLLATALKEFAGSMPLFICEQEAAEAPTDFPDKLGVFIGPEGGWSDAEKQEFATQKLRHLALHDFTLRAETASVTAAAKLLQ